MAYQVIARKWRPQTFEEVTGQEPITRTLRGAIEHERLHHAYLFSGARGVGKTTTARLFAKSLNCHKAERPTLTPCKTTDADQCPSCREIAEGRSIDVLEIDAASNTGVDNVRESIINSVGVRPARDRFKVFIIDEVHMLSGAAFNALLKTLEEPPPRVVFIMATTESHKVPDTILSRCQQFEFRTIATAKIMERLRLIADAEQIKIGDAALREIARAGEGSMRDAQSAFDQVISFSEDEIKTEDVETALGIASGELRARVMRAVAEKSANDALAVVDDLVMRGHDLRNFCRDLLAHVRDLLVIKVAGEATGLADVTEAEGKELARSAKEFSESDLVRFFHSLTETEKALREGAHPRYQLEIGLAKLIEMRRLAPLSQILERLGVLEESLRTGKAPMVNATPTTGNAGSSSSGGGAAPRGSTGGGGSVVVAPNGPSSSSSPRPGEAFISEKSAPTASILAESSTPFDDAPPWDMAPGTSSPPPLKLVPPPSPEMKMSAPNSPGMAAGSNRGRQVNMTTNGASAHGAIVDQIKMELEDRRKPLLATALEGARKVRVEDEELYVEYAPEGKHLRDSLSKPESIKLLREACAEALGREIGVRIVINDGKQHDAAGASKKEDEQDEQRRLREMAEKHPAVKQILRTFRAEIVDVKRVEKEQPGKH